MPSNPFELAVALLFQSSAMIGVIKSSFAQHLKFFSLSASDDLQMLLMTSASQESASDDVSFFRTSCLQNLFSSDASSFLLVDSIALICSFRTYA